MFKLFKNLGKKEWLFAFIAFILIMAQVWLDLKMPDYMSEVTVLVQNEGSKMQDILKNGGYMLACALRKLGIKCNCRVYSIRSCCNSFYEN